MSKVQVRALVVSIGETQEVGNNGFKKREVITQIPGEYPEDYKIEFVQGNTEIPDTLIEGSYVTFHCNLKGRKVDAKKKGDDPKYFLSLQAWKVEL